MADLFFLQHGINFHNEIAHRPELFYSFDGFLNGLRIFKGIRIFIASIILVLRLNNLLFYGKLLMVCWRVVVLLIFNE